MHIWPDNVNYWENKAAKEALRDLRWQLKMMPSQAFQDNEQSPSCDGVVIEAGENPTTIATKLLETSFSGKALKNAVIRFAEQIVTINQIQDDTKIPVGMCLKLPEE